MTGSMQVFAQLTVNGIAVGAIYALVALGLVLIYKATEVLNFAHGDLLMVAAFSAWGLITLAKLPFWLALLVTMALVALLAFVLDAVVIRRIAGQPQFAGVMLTIALAFMIRGLVSMFFGPESRNYATPWSGQTSHVAGLAVADLQLVILGVCLGVTALLFVFFRNTRLGVAMQAASQNQLAAYYMGIPVRLIFSLIWAISAGVAAVAAVLVSPVSLIDVNMGYLGIKAFAAAVLGGFGSIPGALIGGVIVGIVEQLAGYFLPPGFQDVASNVVLLAVLILRPQGLFGLTIRKRV